MTPCHPCPIKGGIQRRHPLRNRSNCCLLNTLVLKKWCTKIATLGADFEIVQAGRLRDPKTRRLPAVDFWNLSWSLSDLPTTNHYSLLLTNQAPRFTCWWKLGIPEIFRNCEILRTSNMKSSWKLSTSLVPKKQTTSLWLIISKVSPDENTGEKSDGRICLWVEQRPPQVKATPLKWKPNITNDYFNHRNILQAHFCASFLKLCVHTQGAKEFTITFLAVIFIVWFWVLLLQLLLST